MFINKRGGYTWRCQAILREAGYFSYFVYSKTQKYVYIILGFFCGYETLKKPYFFGLYFIDLKKHKPILSPNKILVIGKNNIYISVLCKYKSVKRLYCFNYVVNINIYLKNEYYKYCLVFSIFHTLRGHVETIWHLFYKTISPPPP